jgi:Uri superfamily endonuclease
MVIEAKPGTYALILSCASDARIQVGRLGTMQLQRGYYVYLGSALGPGGLRARIAHHQKLSTRPHWHIDYLRAHTRLHSVWFNYDGMRHEHEWALAMQKVKDTGFPFRGLEPRIELPVAPLLLQALPSPQVDRPPFRASITLSRDVVPLRRK